MAPVTMPVTMPVMVPVLGFASASAADPATFSRNAPSFYADPVAWLVATAVGRAVERCDHELTRVRDDVGVVVLSEVATLTTMRAIAAGAARGRVSPIRFAGASPGLLAGLTCLRWKFRGPNLMLSMSPADGAGPAVAVVRGWLASGAARSVVLGAHFVSDGGVHVANCAIVGAGEPRDVRPLLTRPPTPTPTPTQTQTPAPTPAPTSSG